MVLRVAFLVRAAARRPLAAAARGAMTVRRHRNTSPTLCVFHVSPILNKVLSVFTISPC